MKKNFTTLRGNLREEIDHKTLGPMIDSFTSFASDHLGIESLPNVKLVSPEEIGSTSFGGYNPTENSIVLVSKNRHPMDVMRTLAHELVHHKQNEEGRINDVAQEGGDGTDIENEANSRAGVMMRQWGRTNPDFFGLSHITEEVLTEGINDPGIFKAVFLAGGPGSGKDFILQNIIEGNGLVEINSDNALEFLMKKGGLDFMMPKAEEEKRNKVRGRAKNITKEKERLALVGRLGLVINGTATDLEKTAQTKQMLEALGYETMMVFVNTSDEVSRQRNFDRGKNGGRKIPDGTDSNGVPDGSPNIRLEKWIEAQRNRPELQKLFGKQNFVDMDNSTDLRTAPAPIAEKVQKEFLKAFKKIRNFSTKKPEAPPAKAWIKAEKERIAMQPMVSPKAYSYGQNVTPLRPPVEGTIPGFQMTNATELGQMQAAAKNRPVSQPAAVTQQTPEQQPALTSIRKPFSAAPATGETDQANAMGLSYYGFGRWGKNINGQNVVTHISKNGRLVAKQRVMSENVKATYDRIINEIWDLGGAFRSGNTAQFFKTKFDDYKNDRGLESRKVFSTATHDYHTLPRAEENTGYFAVNKKTGKVDMFVGGKLETHSDEGTQTFQASSLEGRTGSPLKAHHFYKDILTHPHNGGLTTILQSDNMQTTGGKKTWQRLARTSGTKVHTYDHTNGEFTQFDANKDPDMIWSDLRTEYDDDINKVVSQPPSTWAANGIVQLAAKQKEAQKVEDRIGRRTLVAFHAPTMNQNTGSLHEGQEDVKMSKKGKVRRKLAATSTLDEDLRQWFKEKWVNVAKPKEGGGYEECGTSGESSEYAKCVPAAKASRMSKKEISSAIRRKRAAQKKAGRPGKDQAGQGNKPIMVKTLKEENVPTNPQLWNQWKQKAKQKFDVYPSAYANAWAAKGYKSAGGGWETKKKSVDEEFRTFSEENGAGDWGTDELTYNYLKGTPGEHNSAKAYKKRLRRKKLTQEAVPMGYEFGNNGIGDEFGVVRSPSGLGFGYSLPMSESAEKGVFDKMGALSGREVEEEKKPLTLSQYRQKIDRRSDFEQKTFTEAKSAAWQRKEGKDPDGGLNKKGVESYRRENPGSKLQTAVTEDPKKLKKGSKKAKRRLSFCRRMKGMKEKLTSSETARDPDSRINKALRKWNC